MGIKQTQPCQLETVRLYPPIIALPKYTNQRSQTLKVGNKTIPINLDTIVVSSFSGCTPIQITGSQILWSGLRRGG